MVGLSQKVISRLTSKVMAIDGDHMGKINIGLSVKFEAKAQKVIGYSRKIGRHWEYSRETVDLIREYKVTGGVKMSMNVSHPRPCRKNSRKSRSTLRRMNMVNCHRLDAFGASK